MWKIHVILPCRLNCLLGLGQLLLIPPLQPMRPPPRLAETLCCPGQLLRSLLDKPALQAAPAVVRYLPAVRQRVGEQVYRLLGDGLRRDGVPADAVAQVQPAKGAPFVLGEPRLQALRPGYVPAGEDGEGGVVDGSSPAVLGSAVQLRLEPGITANLAQQRRRAVHEESNLGEGNVGLVLVPRMLLQPGRYHVQDFGDDFEIPYLLLQCGQREVTGPF